MPRLPFLLDVTLLATLALAQPPVAPVRLDFEGGDTGKPPAGFTIVTSTGHEPGVWTVVEDSTAPSGKKVLAQTSADDANLRFPQCVLDSHSVADVEVSVRFKPVAGKVDQAAGLMVRWLDRDNYYIARANALENNVRLYRVEKGKRKQFAGKDDVKVPANQWQALTLSVKGQHFQVSLDGKLLFEADDPTFKGPGKVGLWTKADSVTRFDDLRIEPK